MNIYLEHANLTVPSIDETLRFLGAAFPEFVVRGGGEAADTQRRWVHVGTQQTYLALNESKHQDIEGNYEGNGLNHIGFVTDDLDSIDRRLKAAGYEEDVSFREESQYRRRHYYYDRNGMEWEFVEYASTDSALRNQYS